MLILKKFRNLASSKGFTLVELLVVIAIIGVLATLILLQLGAARQKARDAKRVADVNQVRSAEELFFDDNGRYSNNNTGAVLTADLVTGRYLTLLPRDPLTPIASCTDYGGAATGCYGYAWDPSGVAANPIRFHLWAELERRSTANVSDIDFDSTVWPATGGARVNAGSATETCPDSIITNQNCTYDVGQTN